MRNVSLFLPSMVACLVLAFAACKHTVQPQIEKRLLSDTQRARQIQLLTSMHPDDIEGKLVSDFPELISIADEVCFENGKIVRYVYHRKGEGGNDDGSDSTAFIEVKDGVIQRYYLLVYTS